MSLYLDASRTWENSRELLISSALEARKNAYCPYSGYPVGAALLTTNGMIFTGCNIENASYGLTNCAERTAVFVAGSTGNRSFVGIVVATKDGGSPCGACRQVLNEFSPNMKVISINGEGNVTSETAINILLPNDFGPANLNK